MVMEDFYPYCTEIRIEITIREFTERAYFNYSFLRVGELLWLWWTQISRVSKLFMPSENSF